MKEQESLNLEEYKWGAATFWYDRAAESFELYGHPFSRHSYCVYCIDGTWVAEMREYGEAVPVVLLSGLPLFCSWSLRELLALAAVLHSEDTESSLFDTPKHPEVKRISSRAMIWAEEAPSWVADFEPKISS